jgi:hypothetical protein
MCFQNLDSFDLTSILGAECADQNVSGRGDANTCCIYGRRRLERDGTRTDNKILV